MEISTDENRELTFAALKEEIRAAEVAGALVLDLGLVAGELAGAFADALKITMMRFDSFKLPTITDSEVRVNGVVRLPAGRQRTFDVGVSCRFFDAGGRIGYTVVAAPLKGAVENLLGDVKKVIDLLPMQIESLWFTMSSVEIPRLTIDIPGKELADALVNKGRGYFFRFESRIIELLELESAVFALAEQTTPLRLSTRLGAALRVPPVLEIEIERISITDEESIVVSGTGKLDFFGAGLSFRGDLGLSLDGFNFELPIQDFIAPFDKAFFKAIKLRNTVATFEGNLQAYTVGMHGEFVIEGSGHVGKYDVKYAAGGVSSIPDLFELYAEKLTLSDALTVLSGFVVTLPEFLDRLIQLERAYFFYATWPGIKTRSGASSVRGARAYADVNLLGYKAYGDFESTPGGRQGGMLLLDPIRLGNIIEISGAGAGTPRGYQGTRIGKDAIRLEVDTKSASGDIEVSLFGQAAVSCLAELSDKSLDFMVSADLPKPLDKLDFYASLVKDAVNLKARRSLAIDVKAEWGGGKFQIAKPAQVDATIAIAAGPTTATAEVGADVELGPLRFSLPAFAVDPHDLKNLPELLRKQIVEKTLDLLKDATQWLKMIVEGAIAYVGDRAERLAEDIGRELEFTFKKTGKEAAKALKRAGYEIEKAYNILEQGDLVGLYDIMDTMSDAEAFTEREIIDLFRKIASHDDIKFTAHDVGVLLLYNGMPAGKVIKEVQNIVKDIPVVVEVLGAMRRPIHEVATFLKNSEKTAQEAAELLAKSFYDAQKDVINAGLRVAQYPEQEVSRAVNNVFQEAGRGIENFRDEVRRTWRRYTPRVTIKW
jgi:predicted transcriptional regulator